MGQKLNGLGFSFDFGDFKVQALKFTLDITDNTAAVKRRGRPDGFVIGDVESTGTITVDKTGLAAMLNAAKSAGSWQALPTFDINSFAKCGEEELQVEAFGCKAKLSKLLDVDTSSADAIEFEVPFDVTDRDFIKIDGVPYCTELED